MRYVVGPIVSVIGLVWIIWGGRIQRFNARMNRSVGNTWGTGPAGQAYGRVMPVVIGAVFVVVGILLTAGAFGDFK